MGAASNVWLFNFYGFIILYFCRKNILFFVEIQNHLSVLTSSITHFSTLINISFLHQVQNKGKSFIIVVSFILTLVCLPHFGQVIHCVFILLTPAQYLLVVINDYESFPLYHVLSHQFANSQLHLIKNLLKRFNSRFALQ